MLLLVPFYGFLVSKLRRGVFIPVIYLFFAGLFALSCVSPPMEMEDFTASALIVSMVLQLIMAGGVIAAAMRLSNLDDWLGWRWKQWPRVFYIGPVAVVSMLAVFWVIQQCGYMEWMESLGVETIQDTVVLLQECRDPIVLSLLVFMAVIIAPVCEELVFRGYLYPVLKKYGGIWSAAFCSSLFFSLVHNDLAALLPLFLLALLLVWLYEVTGSIWAPIAVHFCFNATTVLVQLAARDMDFPSALWHFLPFKP